MGTSSIRRQRQHGGVDGRGIDQRLVALNVHDHLGGVRGRDFGHAIGAGAMIARASSEPRAERPRCVIDALVVGSDNHLGKIARLASPLINMLQHGLTGDRVRDFPGNREEANRAGITPSNLFGTIDLITGWSGVGKTFFWAANERE